MDDSQSSSDIDNIPGEQGRGRSTIEFPYLDLETAIETANAIHELGGRSCGWEQLAGYMNAAPKGGGFRMRMMTARTFGLLDYDRGSVTLRDLGVKAIDPQHTKAARVESFLAVPLFEAIFNKLSGTPLPPLAAIERMMENLGVAPKQKDKARQVFMRSAKQAGFLDINPDRLITPTIGSLRTPEHTAESMSPPAPLSETRESNNLDPLIQGLVKRLPEPGTEWPIAARVKWLQAAANNFDLIFENAEGDRDKEISVTLSQ